MAKKLISHGEKKTVLSFEPKSILVRLSEGGEEGYPIEKYIVKFDGDEQSFQYDGKKFYMDEYNHERMNEERTAHTEEAKKMEEEGMSKEDVKAHFLGKGTEYIDRVEVIMDDILYKTVHSLVSKL